MTAADKPPKTPAGRCIAFLLKLAAVFRARRHQFPESASDASPRPARLDLGDLSVAQFVHDLRNQLTIIMAYADDISSLVPGGIARQEVEEFRGCVERASLLTRELLVAARPRPVERTIVDLNDVITPATANLSRVTGEKVLLRLRLSVGPLPVLAEPLELERIFLNLALNARDAMTDGGTLFVETAIDLAPTAGPLEDGTSGIYARLAITDTGSGIAPDAKARIFEPFFTTKSGSTGLGLSSVAFTVRQLGGTIAVDSQPGRGTAVTVMLPIAREGGGQS